MQDEIMKVWIAGDKMFIKSDFFTLMELYLPVSKKNDVEAFMLKACMAVAGGLEAEKSFKK